MEGLKDTGMIGWSKTESRELEVQMRFFGAVFSQPMAKLGDGRLWKNKSLILVCPKSLGMYCSTDSTSTHIPQMIQ